ncbi:hypothetical protein C789_2729 [Microcystis aeruginosa FACHB-905 = DIANCHI905]|nr:hypothetical protein [Microcystis aeruginosa]ELS47497.1 hypothetical protein C789_2729 [Microcystis aeruginosa FACHB-905 = DIANCHI905]UGS09389.1 hypothetical protein LRR78_01265 [Microcystis aeruginosa FACHB-905 = DIANCHI905]WKX60416.1 hypothetical protein Q3H53_000254 [Microcystis aeruginosa PCC 7806]
MRNVNLNILKFLQSINNFCLSLTNIYQLSDVSFGSSRLCVIIFAYGIVKYLSGKTFSAILRKKLSV